MHSYLFDYMSSILRLSTKYNMSRLRQYAVDKLKQAFPSTLAQFDDPSLRDARTTGEENVFAAIVLARETNCPELLPCALYYCSRLPVDDIVNGDGVHALSREDALLCLLGRDKLLISQRSRQWAFLFRTRRHFYCADCLIDSRVEKKLNVLRQTTTPYPLDLVSDAQWNSYGFCQFCAEFMIKGDQTSRKILWKDLPEFFGLESWARVDELQNE